MVANCASSRGHIGLVAAPCGGGGGAPGGVVWGEAPTLRAPGPSSAAQAKIQLETGVINVLCISSYQDHSAPAPGNLKARTPKGAANAASHTRFSGQRHVVSGAPMWRWEGLCDSGPPVALSAGREEQPFRASPPCRRFPLPQGARPWPPPPPHPPLARP